MKLNQINKEHKELILNLEPNELISFLTNISRKKIDSLGYIKADSSFNIGSVEDYIKFSDIEEDIVNIFVEKAPDKINKEYKKAVADGLTVAIGYNELISKYLEQIQETKLLYSKYILKNIVDISLAIEKDYNYLTMLLDYLYLLLYNRNEEEVAKSIEASFNNLIEDVYTNLLRSIKKLEKYSLVPEKLKPKLETISSEELKTVISDIINFIEISLKYKEILKELEANPFYNASKMVASEYISLVFEEDSITDLDSFKATLKTDKDLRVFNVIYEGFTTDLATYDFNNFKFIVPTEETNVEGVVNDG